MRLACRRVFIISALAVSLSGCFVYHWEAYQEREVEVDAKPQPALPGNELPKYLRVERTGLAANEFLFFNDSDEMIFVEFRNSAAQFGNTSHRVVSGASRVINTDRDSPDTPIAPKTSAKVAFYTPDEGEIMSSLRVMNVGHGIYRIAIRRQSGKTDFAVIHSRANPKPEKTKTEEFLKGTFTTGAPAEDRWLCYLSAFVFCPFIEPSDYSEALAIAKKKFGDDVEVRYVGKTRK